MFSTSFFITNLLLGVGLAMDAFSVSIADGIGTPNMKANQKITVAGTFAVFQFMMPVIGWAFVSMAAYYFEKFQRAIPWIALILLAYIGVRMIISGMRGAAECDAQVGITWKVLIVQGIATSIDALSVGFTIANYDLKQALGASAIIGLITFVICELGIALGVKIGSKITNKASVVGGLILIGIGINIFFSSR